ncbi:alpha/beta hydrolase [Micromonospora endolithica]|uniref:Alpha/beta fold hydrolase n=1 Tax=Micromonospora endolithica TaxID=230091 RepID=A0A3A9ZRY4_9ACTN|nr:alpha/beta fold hydrolase [Micromonospora endolithica]RKN51028.1 alpha/beta fold hydrolase [Micromonospora endolithica]TWJ20175.1 alpha-beta hydrolase superfamily lysophospholipase [Micromonospora endolithica]
MALAPDTVVLIHGLWMTPRSWERWADRYTARGLRVLAPAWPGLEGEVERLRADPTPIAGQSIAGIADHYDRLVRDLPRPPLIMGHSFGGLIAQLLVDRGLGAAAVGVHPAAPKGVVKVPLSTLRSGFSILRNPANRHRAVPFTADDFHYAFGNTLDREASDRAWERYAVPGAGRVLFEGAFANLDPNSPARVEVGRHDRAPLLLLAGTEDHVVPPSVVRGTAALYQRSRALTAYHEFAGRSHFTVGEPGWERVADYALDWAVRAAALPREATVAREAPRY